MKSAALRLLAPQQPTPQHRGRMITVEMVLALLPEKRSRWWVLHSFLPKQKQKLGKMPYWWESDVQAVLHVPAELPRSRAA